MGTLKSRSIKELKKKMNIKIRLEFFKGITTIFFTPQASMGVRQAVPGKQARALLLTSSPIS